MSINDNNWGLFYTPSSVCEPLETSRLTHHPCRHWGDAHCMWSRPCPWGSVPGLGIPQSSPTLFQPHPQHWGLRLVVHSSTEADWLHCSEQPCHCFNWVQEKLTTSNISSLSCISFLFCLSKHSQIFLTRYFCLTPSHVIETLSNEIWNSFLFLN